MGKTRKERNAIRKQGWKQFFSSIWPTNKHLLASLPGIASTGAALVKGSKGDVAGAALSGASMGSGIAHYIQGMKEGWKGTVGLWKGIFNHPSWYAFEGKISVPAFNENRPFDPGNVVTVAGEYPFSPGVGVTHVIQQNVVYEDVSESEYFRLACLQAFKDIRMMLKTNLPYSEDAYRQYVRAALSILVKVKAIERTLGWYNVVRPDIPELQQALLSVSENPYETGKVAFHPIHILENYAQSIAAYAKLQTVVKEIGIPQNLADFVSWWLGGSFIDQAAVNPQIYVNMLREAPVYRSGWSESSGYFIEQVDTWDIADGSIEAVINEAFSFLQTFSMMNADICKTRSYGRILADDVGPGYQTVVMNDDEFFSILINNYTVSRLHPEMVSTFKEDYIRVDFKESLNPANTVGVCNALATWAGAAVPLRIVSQNAYFTTREGLRIARNGSGSVALPNEAEPSDIAVLLYDASDSTMDGFFYQFTSDMVLTQEIAIGNAEPYVTITPTKRLAPDTVASYLDGCDVVFKPGYSCTIDKRSDGTFHHEILLAYVVPLRATAQLKIIIQGTHQGGAFSETSVKFYANEVQLDLPEEMWTLTRAQSSGAVIFKLNGGTLTINRWDQRGAAFIDFLKAGNGVNYTSHGIAIVDKWVGHISDGYRGDDYVQYSLMNAHLIPMLIEQVDYHIPVLYGTRLDVIKDVYHEETEEYVPQRLLIYQGSALLKECYVPVILNYDDLNQVMYWMYLGLFSLKTRFTPPKPRSGDSRKGEKSDK